MRYSLKRKSASKTFSPSRSTSRRRERKENSKKLYPNNEDQEVLILNDK
ncbi:MAG: hypothetical protein AABY22_18560 [Nanoarchaeota archaeon]